MANSPKKVLVRRFSGDILPGYLPQAAFVRNRSIDLLDLSGRLISLPLNDIKTICYVRDYRKEYEPVLSETWKAPLSNDFPLSDLLLGSS